MRLYSFGLVIIPQANGIQNLTVPMRSALVPLQNGSFDQDGAMSYLESKVLTAQFWVGVNSVDTQVTDIDDFIDSLFAEAGKGRRTLVAEMRDNTKRYVKAKMINASVNPNARIWVPDNTDGVDGYAQVSVTFEVAYPYWRAVADAPLFADDGWLADEGLFADSEQALTGTITGLTTTTFTVPDAGNVAHNDSTLVVECGAGDQISGLRVLNLTTNEELDYTGLINANETLTIRTLPQTIDIDGTGVYSAVSLANTQVGFWSMAPGVNEFQLILDSITGNIPYRFTWQRHYIR